MAKPTKARRNGKAKATSNGKAEAAGEERGLLLSMPDADDAEPIVRLPASGSTVRDALLLALLREFALLSTESLAEAVKYYTSHASWGGQVLDIPGVDSLLQ